MSYNHYDIDNDDGLFNFDPYDVDSTRLQQHSPSVLFNPADIIDNAGTMSSHDDPLTSEELVSDIPNASQKGKEVSMPMPIRASTIIRDLFDVSPSNADPSSCRASDISSFSHSSFTFSPPPSSSSGSYRPTASSPLFGATGSLMSLHAQSTSYASRKGKGRELPPTLPPLSFCSSGIGYDQGSWLLSDTSQSAGPSSFSTTFNAVSETPPDSLTNTDSDFTSPSTPIVAPCWNGDEFELRHIPTRSRSLSSLTVETSHPHISTSSLVANTGSKAGPIRTPSNLARKFIFGKRPGVANHLIPSIDNNSSVGSAQLQNEDLVTVNATGNTPAAWYAASSANETRTLISRPPPPSPVLALEYAIAHPPSRGFLKSQGRSNSSPLPFSALDYIPVSSTDIFEPLPLFIRNYFDEILPREIRLHIFQSLVQVHINDHQRVLDNGRWTSAKASSLRGQWVGKDKGIRELIKLSRVSKSWRALVFDGQLWVDLDLHSFPGLPQHVVRYVTQSGGTFITSLNVAGHVNVDSNVLLDIASNMCLTVPQESLSYTQLTIINLQGCNGLSTRALHHLLIRSRFLRKLVVKGLAAVTNTTCEILATYCPNLISLNMSRCMNIDAEGIKSIANTAIVRKEHLALKEIWVSGLKHISDRMMRALGRAAPHLEVLDLSYARQMHNSALEAFVACDEEELYEMETVVVSARDLGREVNDSSKYRRRVTRLRHLNLSFCLLLTDTGCANLSHSLPCLEFLELAGIGSDLKDPGLIRLLERTPLIRRLDLEDASDITDALLATITPVLEAMRSSSRKTDTTEETPQPGHALQQINISYATRISDDAFLRFIRQCTNLTVLGADNTRMGSAVLREFLRLSKERKLLNAKVVAVDCRGIGENLVKDLSGSTRPRQGWRSYAARKLCYLDGRDGNEEDLKIGQDECDESRMVLKTFYSWQTVDAVKANREKRRKTTPRRAGNGSSGIEFDDMGPSRINIRWWSPGSRRSGSGSNSSPTISDFNNNDGCRAM